MKKVLIVGDMNFYEYKKLAETYTNALFIREMGIRHDGSNALIELVRMFDEVLFVGEPSDRIAYEVACAMKNIRIAEMSTYPLVDEKVGEENAETV